MFCKNCGNEIKEGQQFCEKCGTKADTTNTETSEAEKVKSKGKRNYNIVDNSNISYYRYWHSIFIE